MKKLIFLELILLFLSTTFQSDNPPGWYQQTLPVNDFVNDIFFLDSLNGWVVTKGNASTNDSGYILKTTDAGSNWNLNFMLNDNFEVIQFLDGNIGFAGGGFGRAEFLKTINGGINWIVSTPFGSNMYSILDLQFLNKDTGWICSDDFFGGGIYQTINAGNSWIRQLNETYEPSNLFFLNKDTGYAACNSTKLYRTINGGLNWDLYYEFPSGISDIYFFNQEVGIVSSNVSYRSTNGGLNWTQSNLGGSQITFVNDSIGWQGGNFIDIKKSTNGGINWFSQFTNTNNPSAFAISDLNAWAGGNKLIRTTDGGGLSGIAPIGNQIPDIFILNQNYPNPFNPVTVVSYQITVNCYVQLTVFEIHGKIVEKIVNQKQKAGKYEIQFDGSGLSSGLYFYKIQVSDESTDRVYTETKKMLLIK